MIRTNDTLTVKNGSQLQIGELFIANPSGSGRELFLKLFDVNGGSVHGVLQSHIAEPMSWTEIGIGTCLSYGTEWALEEIHGPETTPGNTFSFKPEHRLFIDGDGALVWRFFVDNQQPQTLISLGEPLPRNSLATTAAPIGRFQIWAAADAYNDPRSHPIFTWPAPSHT